MTRKFKTNEEISPRELVQYGLDHLGAGATLFKGTPEHYDSAGYLIHIGYECLLKGWWLYQDKEIESGHSLLKICARNHNTNSRVGIFLSVTLSDDC